MSDPRSGQQGPNIKRGGATNGTILSFFKPVPATVSDTRPSSITPPPKLSVSPPSSPPLASLSPAAQPSKTEIAASDDESDRNDGGFSDDSLEDLSSLVGRAKGSLPTRQPPLRDPLTTPKAKRTAVEFHSSPLAIMPRHKFDFKALAKDARRDSATTASSLKIEPVDTHNTVPRDATTLPGTESVAKLVVKDEGGQDAQKVLRAVNRSAPSQGLLRHCFFEPDYKAPQPPAVPKLSRDSPWLLLTEGSLSSKEQHLLAGLPQTILLKCGGLPDELFEWMLSSLCLHSSVILRQEYSNMITYCSEQTGRLITTERITHMFGLLGARTGSDRDAPLELSATDRDPLNDRDWSCLQTVLTLMGVVAPDLSVSTVETASHILLQMALDKVVISNAAVLAEYEFALRRLLEAVPSPTWDDFCFESCRFFQDSLDIRSIKVTALLCVPICSSRAHDIRRRLAVTTLLRNADLGRWNVQITTKLTDLGDALDDAAFCIGPDTDFAEFRASVILLDMAIDDGFVVKFQSREEESEFNAIVDELASKLREIWRKINDAGMKLARTEAKSVVEWVQHRLSHSVRTRRKVKASVFDIPGQTEDPFLPQQREYMKKFLQQPTKGSPSAQRSVAAASDESGKGKSLGTQIESDTIVVASD